MFDLMFYESQSWETFVAMALQLTEIEQSNEELRRIKENVEVQK